jgi:hypothetical protein
LDHFLQLRLASRRFDEDSQIFKTVYFKLGSWPVVLVVNTCIGVTLQMYKGQMRGQIEKRNPSYINLGGHESVRLHLSGKPITVCNML